jgi:hypothetical protein
LSEVQNVPTVSTISKPYPGSKIFWGLAPLIINCVLFIPGLSWISGDKYTGINWNTLKIFQLHSEYAGRSFGLLDFGNAYIKGYVDFFYSSFTFTLIISLIVALFTFLIIPLSKNKSGIQILPQALSALAAAIGIIAVCILIFYEFSDIFNRTGWGPGVAYFIYIFFGISLLINLIVVFKKN